MRRLLSAWDPIEAVRGCGFLAILAASAWLVWQGVKLAAGWW